MTALLERLRTAANWTRYAPGQRTGHYESFFVRANHPTRPLAFWIRYTIFSPDRHPEGALGELWAVAFDGETHQHVAVKQEVPFADCSFDRSALRVRIAEARFEPGELTGGAASGGHSIAWNLTFRGDSEPLFLLAPNLYETGMPRAKSLVAMPLATFDGQLSVDGKPIDLTSWVGSQNHNWGSRHTDHYAWGQVAGFDEHPASCLELATARLHIGPLWTPFMTLLVLRHGGREFALNTLWQSLRARGSFDYFTWRVRSATDAVAIEATINAPREAFVGLRYANPPGGIKCCLNSKLAACEVRLTLPGKAPEMLTTRQRAAFEILTDDERRHGVALRA